MVVDSDYDRTLAMLRATGVRVEEQPLEDTAVGMAKSLCVRNTILSTEAKCEQPDPNDPYDWYTEELGYKDFYSVWYFDKNGTFLGVGHWE